MVLKLTLNKKVSLSVTLRGNDTFFFYSMPIYLFYLSILVMLMILSTSFLLQYEISKR